MELASQTEVERQIGAVVWKVKETANKLRAIIEWPEGRTESLGVLLSAGTTLEELAQTIGLFAQAVLADPQSSAAMLELADNLTDVGMSALQFALRLEAEHHKEVSRSMQRECDSVSVDLSDQFAMELIIQRAQIAMRRAGVPFEPQRIRWEHL